MNKVITFLIVAVLIARGAIYIYDHNKGRADKLVAPVDTVTTETSTNTTQPVLPTDVTDTKEVSYTALTFLLTEGNDIYYYAGPFNGTLNTINRDYVGVFIQAYKNNMNPDDLMFIIKSGEDATLKQAIDMLDEMTKNKVPPGHYEQAAMTQEEIDKIKLIKNKKNG